MTSYICEEYQKEPLFHLLAKQSENGTVMGVRLLTLRQFLLGEKTMDPLQAELTLMQKLRPHAGEYENYGAMFGYPVFIREVLTFARQCALYGITPDDLPDRRAGEKELRRILQEALALPLEEKLLREHREEYIAKLCGDDIKLVSSFEEEPFYHAMKEEAIRRGARTFDLPRKPAEHVLLRHILSMTKEIEACAQDICQRGKDCTVILCDPTTQMPHVETVFRRYGIPFSYTGRQSPSLIHSIYAALARLACEPTNEHLVRAIRLGSFSAECPPGLLSYIERISDPAVLIPRTVGTDYQKIMAGIRSEKDENTSYKDFLRMDDQLRYYFSGIQEELEALLEPEQSEGLSESAGALAAAYRVIRTSPLLKYDTVYELAGDLRRSLQNVLPLVQDRNDAEYVIRCMETVGSSSWSFSTDFCQVTDLRHPSHARSLTYVLGADGEHYPGFSARKGLFDEEYTGQIPAFPSLNERYALYTAQMKWLRESGSEIIYSYYTNDTSGREKIPAFELEEYADSHGLDKQQKWNLAESSYRYRPAHTLAKDTAVRLFTKDGINVHGSISSIESWFRCPYSYFIKYGLRIRQNDLPKLDAALTGTIHHAAMEVLVREYRKAYPQYMDTGHLRALVHAYFEALAVTCVKDAPLLRMSEERMLDTLVKVGRFLDRAEKDAPSFEPVLTEADFHDVVFADHVVLKGTIDRIDLSTEHALYRIIDYKSSDNDLKEPEVRAGLKLQLLTYMIAALQDPQILQVLKDASPAGAYYVMLKEDIVSDKKSTAPHSWNKRSHTGTATQWKYRKYEDDPMSRYVEKNRFEDAHSIGGWTFIEDLSIADAGTSLKNRKHYYSVEAVQDCLEDVYAYFYSTLLSEDGIRLEPVKYGINGPCEFCDYKPVCRFHGELYAPVERSEAELKGGDYEN